MITFFTTFKDFKGKNRVNQLNAIRSWLYLDKDVEVIVFSESDGIEEVLNDDRVVHVRDITLYNNRVPLIGPMFNQADKLSKNQICCFSNSDIILTTKMKEVLVNIHQAHEENYLLVGQRFDVDVEEEIEFDRSWEENFWKEKTRVLHPPTGSDFFVFPKGQYDKLDFPTLLVGRPGWDLWMVYHSLQQKNRKVIDLSPTVKVIHQNHDYAHKSKKQQERELEDNINYKAFSKHPFFFTIRVCNYVWENGQLKKNLGRGDIELYLRVVNAIKKRKSISKLLIALVSPKSSLSSNLTRSLGLFFFKIFHGLKII